MASILKKSTSYTYKVPKWLKDIARPFNIEFRVSDKPSEADIMGVDDHPTYSKSQGVYIAGTGVIWIRKTQNFKHKSDTDFMAAHELGHAMMDMIKWKKGVTEKHHEIMANAVALALIMINQKPLSNTLAKHVGEYPAHRSLYLGSPRRHKNVKSKRSARRHSKARQRAR